MDIHHFSRKEQGFALLITLWVLVFLSIVTMSFIFIMRLGLASTRNFKEETVAYYNAMTGYQEAIDFLMEDKDPTVDFIDTNGNLILEPEGKSFKVQSSGPGRLDVKIEDEESKININTAGADVLTRLFLKAGVSDEDVGPIVDSVLDWRSPAGTHRLLGTKSEYYESLDEPYMAKDGPFDTPRELLLVKGVDKKILYGDPDKGTEGIIKYITTFTPGPININTVQPDVMEILGLTPQEIEGITFLREGKFGPMKGIAAGLLQRGIAYTASNYFRIESTGSSPDGKINERITAVVQRIPSDKGYKIRVLYWKANVQSIRS